MQTIIPNPAARIKWSCGVTTVPSRKDTLLPRTLDSIRKAGFNDFTLFVDGSKEDTTYYKYSANVVFRYPQIRTYGNWILSIAELYIRNPLSDRYVMFQDDFITYHNLKEYLSHVEYKDKTYWNLYTFPSNQILAPHNGDKEYIGFYESNQLGRGAVGLVFNKKTVIDLLANQHMVERVLSVDRGWRSVDGGVVTALNQIGYKELVHNPSLVQHTGIVSSMGNKPHKLATSFRGEFFNALELLGK